jgi:hypothetical protein
LVDADTGSKYLSKVEIVDGEEIVTMGGDVTLEEGGIRAEDFWEDYFNNNPSQKPKHIVYYDGDPTNAVSNFFKENGILEKDSYEALLGFDNHIIVDNLLENKYSSAGLKELEEMVESVIMDYYGR